MASVLDSPEERTDFDRLMKGPNAYRTISEVADELHVPQHVLRFWETRFPEVKPLKRGGGRRYYSPTDIEILRHITDLLYVQGYTIKGVQRVLKEQPAGVDTVVVSAPGAATVAGSDPAAGSDEAVRSSFEIPAFQSPDPEQPQLTENAENDAVTEAVHVSPGVAHGLNEPKAVQGLADAHMSGSDSGSGSGSGTGAEDFGEGALEHSGRHEPTVVDSGEETSSLSVVAVPEETSVAPPAVATQPTSPSDNDGALVTILQDELESLRIEQGRWMQERRALRLALEDVLGELDSLREMLPNA